MNPPNVGKMSATSMTDQQLAFILPLIHSALLHGRPASPLYLELKQRYFQRRTNINKQRASKDSSREEKKKTIY